MNVSFLYEAPIEPPVHTVRLDLTVQQFQDLQKLCSLARNYGENHALDELLIHKRKPTGRAWPTTNIYGVMRSIADIIIPGSK